ncbi:MAG: hypothetical protein JWO92_2467 [Chitinophagaceae bacterium]|nr:hypothetical protein [Chitinophagaceae bacterium]
MKKLSFFIAGFFTVLTASAQYGRQYYNSTVTVTLNGNSNEQVYIDGRNYTSGYANGAYNNTVQITDLQPGQHTIQVVNNNNNGRKSILGALFGRRNNNVTASTAFNVREGYDTQIAVRPNGRVQVRETRSTAYRNNRKNNRYNNNQYNNNQYYR